MTSAAAPSSYNAVSPVTILGFSLQQLALGVGLFLVSLVVTSAIVTAFIVWIPADHFVAGKRGLAGRIASPAWRVAAIIGKNLLGVVLVVAGLALSLPGVPGQGLLTMLVGLLLLDIPGKRRFELALVRRRRIGGLMNKLRVRFKREPLLLQPPDEAPASKPREEPPAPTADDEAR